MTFKNCTNKYQFSGPKTNMLCMLVAYRFEINCLTRTLFLKIQLCKALIEDR